MLEPLITFIIPSTGRKTITNTLNSLINQNNPLWVARVGFDFISEETKYSLVLPDDKRITYIFYPHKLGAGRNYGGIVRNTLIEDATTEWIGFVDDDDSLRPDYIDRFIEEKTSDNDLIMFRMSYDDKDEKVLPPLGVNIPIVNEMGISFAIRKLFLYINNLRFVNHYCEDFLLLREIYNKGGIIKFSDHITYNVKY